MQLRWDPTVGAGAVLQAITVIIVIGGAVMAYSAFTTSTNLRLITIEQKAADNQAQLLEKIGEVRTEAANREAASVKANADLRTELSNAIKENSTLTTQLKTTLDQKLPTYDEKFSNLFSLFAGLSSRMDGFDKWQIDTGQKVYQFDQFRAKVESASPGPAKRGG